LACENRWEGKGLYRLYLRKISGKDLLNSNLTIQGDPRFDDLRYIVNDFTKVEEFDGREIDISRIAMVDSVAAKSNSDIKIAIVSNNEMILKWIYLYSEKMQGSLYDQIKIFDNTDDAYQWAVS
jgi:hypothetical protein